MRLAHTVEVVRIAEAALMAKLPAGALMQRAAAGLAAACAQLLGQVYGARVVLLVGSGDNGGDVLYAGARLAGRGAAVHALLLAADRTHPGGYAALRAAGGSASALTAEASHGVSGQRGDRPTRPWEMLLRRADLVVDGVVGIGGQGGLRPPAAELADRIQDLRVPVVAADIPSGVDATTGEVAGAAIRADVTVTFGTYKPGLLVDPGAARAGIVELVDIGLAPYLGEPDARSLQAADVHELLPAPTRESDKYRRGVVGVLAGSDTYTGAAVLAVGGALHGGAGLVRFASTPRVGELVRARWPEAIVTAGSVDAAGRVQAWVVGPGIGTAVSARRRLDDVLGTSLPVLVDADGLTLLGERGKLDRAAPTVLTPHAGEAARLLGDEWSAERVEACRIDATRRCADRYGATVLLKGSTTVIATADGGAVTVNPTGTPWLATGGTGDVLAGLGGALLAAGLAPADAAAVAAYLHGLAARLALAENPGPLTALDVAAYLRHAWSAVASAG